MLMLACDTSNSTCCAGVYDNGKELAYEISFETRTHSETFMPLVMRVLQQSGKELRDLDAMAVVVGPGSFTGVRIGISAIKGIAAVLDIPCIAVSSTEALAGSAEHEENIPEDTIMIPCFDARNSRVFASVRDGASLDTLVEENAYASKDLAFIVSKLSNIQNKKIIVLGSGAEVMREALVAADVKAQYAAGAVITPRGVAAAALRSKKTVSGAELKAAYCAVSSAERLRKT